MIQGNVVHGDGIGKTLGFPTANIDCHKDDIPYGPGVYAAWAHVDDSRYPAALAIQAEPWKVEAHLLSYDGASLYDRELKLDVVEHVSGMEPYESRERLIEKIDRDVRRVGEILN